MVCGQTGSMAWSCAALWTHLRQNVSRTLLDVLGDLCGRAGEAEDQIGHTGLSEGGDFFQAL